LRETPTTLTVVVVTYNSREVLGGCLAALPAALDGVADRRVVVVDNASTDGSLELAAACLPEAVCTSAGRNGGYAAAINHALDVTGATGDVLVMNPDVRLQPGSVRRLLDAMGSSGAGIVAPKLVDDDGNLLFSQRRDPTVARVLGEWLLGGRRAGRIAALGEVVTDPIAYERGGWAAWASGAVLLISAECRAAVGAWDESFFLYSEETDYCQRARREGFRVRFEPRVTAVHLEGDLESSGALRRHLVRNKLRLYQRTHGPLASGAFRAALLLNDATRAARGSRRHREGVAELLRPSARGQQPLPPAVAPAVNVADTDRDDGVGFVFFSAQDFWYHNRAHSDFQLARNLAASRPMLFVNSIGMRMPKPGVSTQVIRRLARKLRSMARTVRRPLPELPNLYVMTPVILPFYGRPLLRALNARIVSWQVSFVLRRLGMPEPNAIVTIPTASDVVARMRLRSLIVNRSDKYSAFAETDQSAIREMELALLGRADAAVFVSHMLMDDEAPLVKGEAVFLGHGVDFEHFSSAGRDRMAAQMTDIPGPRIGFFGGLDDYVVDFALLERVAHDLPEAHLVLIGDATCSMEDLVRYQNVHWLGACDYAILPSYGVGFDVAIMPWLHNDWIQHCNPIKVKEYLALGLPVVTTSYPEAAWLSDVIDIAADPDEFISLIEKALAGGGRASEQERRDKVSDDSWARRARVLRDLADRVGA
jgi:GT2 family glycosyltransferase/glycosyltransferase involved in cell wall biosynthesis